ncbi:hypothetical protein MJD09_22925 [bacterium]|nr:hypothetical protein [bacterium]
MRLHKGRLSAVFILFIHSTLFSQAGPPDTEIFLVDLKNESGRLHVGEPRNVTNRVGYDNQPFFLPSGEGILYTSIGADGQADIYQYHLEDGKTVQITDTPESEYSPTPMPDGNHYSVVRVEADSSQRLWKFSLAGGEPSLVLEDLKPVGYHAWASDQDVVLFVLGRPNSLYHADVANGKSKKVMGSIGRSLHKIPGKNSISFVHKASEDEWWIKEMALGSKTIRPLVKTLNGSEDYAWTPEGVILMGKGSKLYKWQSERDESWVEVADFTSGGLKAITRLAVSPNGDQIAVVSTK